MAAPQQLRTLLGEHPVTAALLRGDVSSDLFALDLAKVKVPNTAFKRVVRDLEFDVAELAIVTFLMAKDQGVPLSLLPAVLVARFQHPFIVYNADRGQIGPRDLAGKRVGIRSWTVTTVMWIKAILANDYDVDLDAIEWVTFEDAHVAGFDDPPGVLRAADGQSMASMLRTGEIDAAVMTSSPEGANNRPVIADAADASLAWAARYGAIQLNHLVAVKSELVARQPEVVLDVYRCLERSKLAASPGGSSGVDLNPFGVEANRRNLEIAIRFTREQGLIERTFAVEDLVPADLLGT